jgi:16S rRNA C967 or C1407 C5-methylase (RsmB/RsmF family)
MEGKGSLFLHDIRKSALQEARKRLKKAGVQNGQFLPPGHAVFKQLKQKCDWILVDVPCTGTGTLRRSPEMKWRLRPESIAELTLLQRQIFEEALQYLKPTGRITYATCSILAKENQEQVDYFLSHFPLHVKGEPLSTFPKVEEMDGFFGVTFGLD